MTPQWPSKKKNKTKPTELILVHALDGFLGAGHASRLATAVMGSHDDIVHEFDIDTMYDYRARRPPITFRSDHYLDYEEPRLNISRETDLLGTEYLLLSGPEPDFGWESFVTEVIEVIEEEGVSLTVGLGSIPMGVPHTRPAVITAHATKPELVDRPNLWQPEVTVPSSAQALLEYRMAQQDLDGIGYVVHVPHYVAQNDYPPAALALFDSLSVRTGLTFDLEELRAAVTDTMSDIERQVSEQGGEEVLSALEEQYDSFTRGAAKSLLADESHLPSGDELAAQLELFLQRQRHSDD